MDINPLIEPSPVPQTSRPVEFQNVEIQAGKVKSKIGFAAMAVSLSLWLSAVLLMVLLFTIVSATVGDKSGDLKGTVVLVISFGIPVLAIFAFALYRLRKIIQQDARVIDDVFFRKSVRFNLFTAAFLGVILTGTLIYNVLALTVLQNADVTTESILDSAVMAGIAIGLALFFWSYQRRTTK